MKNNKGFSLVELIVVVAIMAVLVGVAAPTYIKYVESTKVQKDVSAVGEALQALSISFSTITVYDNVPTDNSDITVTWENGKPVAITGNAQVTDDLKTAIKNELDAVNMGELKFESNTHKASGKNKYVAVCTYNTTTKTYVVDTKPADGNWE